MRETTYATPGLLLDRGFEYDSSLMDSDVPYVLAEDDRPDARTLVEIPVHWALDDWEQYAYVVEVSPAYDHAEVTALAAATIVYDVTTLMAGGRQTR